nr:portal protein [Coprothermobacter proteolyticus]
MSLLESLQTFFLKKSDKEEQLQVKDNNLSPVAPSSQNGEVAIVGGVQSAADTSAVSTSTPNDKELIELYRSIARIPEVAEAVDEIVNEIISVNDEGEPVSLDLEELELSESVKKKIREEFDNVLDVVDFDTRGHDLVRRWYIDGRLAGHKVIDKKKPADGIKEFRYINPLSLEKVIEYKKVKEGKIEVFQCVKEYYKYNPTN